MYIVQVKLRIVYALPHWMKHGPFVFMINLKISVLNS